MASLMPDVEIGDSIHGLRRVGNTQALSSRRWRSQRTFPFTVSQRLAWWWGQWVDYRCSGPTVTTSGDG